MKIKWKITIVFSFILAVIMIFSAAIVKIRITRILSDSGLNTEAINSKINNAMLTTGLILAVCFLICCFISYRLGSYISKAYRVIRRDLNRLEQGDFNVVFKESSFARKDEIGDIINSFYHMQERVKEIINSIKTSTEDINTSSLLLAGNADIMYHDVENISATTEELSAGMEETAASTEEINATSEAIVEELNNVTTKAADGQQIAIEIKGRAENLRTVALESQKGATTIYDNANKKLRQSIEKAAAINEIKTLSKTILEITAQTNLLALNASIESARAGDAGKGFAVVASEISTLAQNSKNAVSKIEEISNEIADAVEEIVTDSKLLLDFMDNKVINDYGFLVNAGEQYHSDAGVIEQMVADIKSSAGQLNESISYIRKAIDGVTLASQEGAKGSTEIAEKSASIFHKTNDVLDQANKSKVIANKLSEAVSFFHLDN